MKFEDIEEMMMKQGWNCPSCADEKDVLVKCEVDKRINGQEFDTYIVCPECKFEKCVMAGSNPDTKLNE